MAFANSVGTPDKAIAEINITPLVDVMLALLLIFMLTAPMVQRSLQLPLARPDGPAKPLPKVLDLTIAADGQVLYDGSVLSPAELEAQLMVWAQKSEPISLNLSPAGATTHQSLIQVLALANKAGIKDISIEQPH